ncbi:probable serine/threonine-protein kinase PBL15 [Impatiens glandulifera]|uniref:probable serine/threonine-protein kinase PBL15 n=1 Tax=Impatiens glandulifera TaxID=253017 RepID=UPI001FB08720|nr:probable serine/threonine-protein kinase PBL15 [Impatiens glandulifera]
MISSAKAKSNVECAFSSKDFISAGGGTGAGFIKGAHRPCCFNNARTLICHKLKLFLPVNLSVFKTFTFNHRSCLSGSEQPCSDTNCYYFSCADSKDIVRFDSVQLKKFTNNFSEEYYIGRFQFGKIFRGLFKYLCKGPIYLTVKIWDDYENLQHNLLRQGDEMLLLHHEKYTCHPGMARMYGYCPEDKYVAIVLFFKPMDSVHNLLLRDEFTWLYRIKVAFGVASILKYLHDVSPHIDPFIIRNLDAAHILLDEEYNPTLIDFGLITGGIFPNRPMNVVKSSLECHDQVLPVYDKSGTWTTKSDVYSFGVLLLCLTSKRDKEDIKKVFVHKSLRTDPTYNRDDGQGIRRLAVQCLQTNPDCRPTMLEVVEDMQKLRVVESHPGDFMSLNKIPRVNYPNHLNLTRSHLIQHV